MTLDGGYGYMTYSVEPANDYTTHGYKTRLKRNEPQRPKNVSSDVRIAKININLRIQSERSL